MQVLSLCLSVCLSFSLSLSLSLSLSRAPPRARALSLSLRVSLSLALSLSPLVKRRVRFACAGWGMHALGGRARMSGAGRWNTKGGESTVLFLQFDGRFGFYSWRCGSAKPETWNPKGNDAVGRRARMPGVRRCRGRIASFRLEPETVKNPPTVEISNSWSVSLRSWIASWSVCATSMGYPPPFFRTLEAYTTPGWRVPLDATVRSTRAPRRVLPEPWTLNPGPCTLNPPCVGQPEGS